MSLRMHLLGHPRIIPIWQELSRVCRHEIRDARGKRGGNQAFYIGVYASGAAASYAGIGGGVVVLAGLLIRKRLLFLAIIIAGAVPLAVLTWWSIVKPIIAFAAIAFGGMMARRMKI